MWPNATLGALAASWAVAADSMRAFNEFYAGPQHPPADTNTPVTDGGTAPEERTDDDAPLVQAQQIADPETGEERFAILVDGNPAAWLAADPDDCVDLEDNQ